MRLVGVGVGFYGVLSVASGVAAYWLHGSLLTFEGPWLELTPLTAHVYSAVVGLTIGVLLVALTPVAVRRFEWARTLHEEMRPLVAGLSGGTILLLAVLSALGEELFFRSVLQPALGLWLQALIFGLLHQLPGPARWTWVSWATIMGVLFGMVFAATGSLVGPLLAHATINGLNLRFLQHHDSMPPPRTLGGVLGHRS